MSVQTQYKKCREEPKKNNDLSAPFTVRCVPLMLLFCLTLSDSTNDGCVSKGSICSQGIKGFGPFGKEKHRAKRSRGDRDLRYRNDRVTQKGRTKN